MYLLRFILIKTNGNFGSQAGNCELLVVVSEVSIVQHRTSLYRGYVVVQENNPLFLPVHTRSAIPARCEACCMAKSFVSNQYGRGVIKGWVLAL
jgi:hypothetical protein